MAASNLVAVFIIVAPSATLHASGGTKSRPPHRQP